ncbi:unnamed protein product [Amoebophrya sp. A120]|nr:unnamed protein product [Amoebophrya sp. A120]|eukprot:GSA120T00005887001.1
MRRRKPNADFSLPSVMTHNIVSFSLQGSCTFLRSIVLVAFLLLWQPVEEICAVRTAAASTSALLSVAKTKSERLADERRARTRVAVTLDDTKVKQQQRQKVDQQQEENESTRTKQTPRGFTACQNFLRNRKAQLISGPDLVRVVESMCQPAVTNGNSSYRYRKACKEMQAVTLEKYGHEVDWDPAALCHDLMTRFHQYSPSNAQNFNMDG